jgi:hypothetical protein
VRQAENISVNGGSVNLQRLAVQAEVVINSWALYTSAHVF